ncbi:ATP-binding cassette domain-containing protein [Paenibacillus radicis (ex Xue et al. 2023)]|uniref:ATP-binding cassette domain-containing protein n=1 Tax=Paenibacillus radicis (ex Xue et al. 2023) TaxID=2972489 RepID=A0ABT1YKJ7_9BACL|nr:ATP-binding cassette domain-containing protein [Paenibacillus radicis (ex Xue et al. 2023)]MCR8633699.1 ATP-binding cassette domain-containing protein [Paenibacillus radicis (ex Xue et al. 2023)]
MICIRDVSFSYFGGEADRWALRDIDLDIKQDEFIAFLGPNGSGKSSLSKLLNGIEWPTEGSITVDELSTTDPADIPSVRRLVQIVFQNPENQQVGVTVGEDISFGLSNIGWPHHDIRNRIRWVLDLVQLNVDEDRLVSQLSGGEKQKLALASVLALSPRYLILDESTSMLDPIARSQFVDTLHAARKEHPFAIIYITHHLVEVLHADRLVLFKEGRIHQIGKPDDILTDEDLLTSCGLELPFDRSLALSLRKAGIPISVSPSIEELRKWL